MKVALTVNDHRVWGIDFTRYGISYTLFGLTLFLGPEPYVGRN